MPDTPNTDYVRLLDRARASFPDQRPSASDLHWQALSVSPTARHWLRRSEVEAYLNTQIDRSGDTDV